MLKRIHFPPGINHQSTQFSASGSWYDADNIRFKSGIPEMVGGWSRDAVYSLQGIGRACFSNRDYDGNNYQYAATDWKVYVITGDTATDITPVRASGSLTSSPFTIIDESSEVLVSHESHGLSVNDWVVFPIVTTTTGASGVTAANLSQSHGFQVSTVYSAAVYAFYLVDWETGDPIVPSGSEVGTGGATTYSYKIASGLSAQVSGQGFGAGLWGGSSVPTVYDLSTSSTSGDEAVQGTTGSSGQVIFRFVTSGGPTVSTSRSVYFTELVGEVNDLDLSLLNNKWWNVDTVTAGVGTAGSYTEFKITSSDPERST